MYNSGRTGSNVHDLVTGERELYGIAVDLAGSKMYWNDGSGSTSRRIRRSGLDGSQVETLITGFMGGIPWGIPVDPAHGKLYWTASSRVQRADLDGTGQETVVEVPGGYAANIELDVAGGKTCWADGANTIHRANLDGSGVETILTHPFVNARDPAVIPVPEPATFLLLALGSVGVMGAAVHVQPMSRSGFLKCWRTARPASAFLTRGCRWYGRGGAGCRGFLGARGG